MTKAMAVAIAQRAATFPHPDLMEALAVAQEGGGKLHGQALLFHLKKKGLNAACVLCSGLVG